MKPPPSASAPLVVEEYRDATVMPVTPYQHPRRRWAFQYGVFDRHGEVVSQSLLFRSHGRRGFAADYAPASRTDPRTVIFAGHFVDMYGHFLLEGLSRLWHARSDPELPIVWACAAGQPAPAYRDWQRELLELLGVRNEAIFLTEPTRFGAVHVPAAGYRIQDWCSEQYARFLAVYPRRVRDPDRRLWLTRAGVDRGLGSTFAHRLDRELAAHGWTIVRPEELSLRDQLESLATAARVAGEEGSAFHSLLLLSDVSGLQVDIIGRRPQRDAERQNQNYETIARARGLSQRIQVVPEERTLFARGRYVRKVATTIRGHLEVAGVTRPVVSLPPEPADGARALVTRVADAVSAGSYLEVGIDLGGPRPGPEVALRDIVRPAFADDPRPADGHGQQLYEMPPDEFFDFLADRARGYDLVYIDAPGEPRSLWRWLVAGRRYAADSAMWVLRGSDETLPARVANHLRSTTVATEEGPCVLLAGPGADLAAVEAAVRR